MRVFFKRVIKLMQPYIFHEISGVLLTILFILTAAATPMITKYLIDNIILKKTTGNLYLGLGLLFLACIIEPIAGYFKDLIFLNISENITLNIRRRLFLKVINASLKFFSNTKKGEIISRIVNDGRGASEFITNFFVVFLKDIVFVIVAFAGMLYLSVMITAISLSVFLALFTATWRLSRRFSSLQTEIQKNHDSICTNVNQMTENIISIKSFLVECRIIGKYNDVVVKTFKDNKKIGQMNILLNNLANIITFFCMCIIYGIGTLGIASGDMTLGTMMAAIMYFQMLVQPFNELVNNNIQLRKTMPILDRVYEYFDMENEVLSCEGQKLNGDIIVSNLSFSYDNKINALNDLNLHIAEHSLTAFVGGSGSGKSTFINILLGFLRPSGGSIRIGNRNILEMGVNILRENISLVPQEIELFNMSIKENIKCGKPDASDNEIIDLCKKLRLHHKIVSLTEGYESIISERINLSGGEKQRLAIARALIKKTAILVFDEPTSALDPENELIVRDILEAASKDCTVIVIAHRITTIMNADKIFVFNKGEVVEEGTHNTLLERNSIYAGFVLNHENSCKPELIA